MRKAAERAYQEAGGDGRMINHKKTKQIGVNPERVRELIISIESQADIRNKMRELYGINNHTKNRTF